MAVRLKVFGLEIRMNFFSSLSMCAKRVHSVVDCALLAIRLLMMGRCLCYAPFRPSQSFLSLIGALFATYFFMARLSGMAPYVL